MLSCEVREASAKVRFGLKFLEHFVVMEERVREQAVNAARDGLKVFNLAVPNLKAPVKVLRVVQDGC